MRPHTESVLPGRSGGNVQPVHLAKANLDTVRDTIVGKTIVVQRAKNTEAINVAKVTSLKNGNVNFHDGDKSRSVKPRRSSPSSSQHTTPHAEARLPSRVAGLLDVWAQKLSSRGP